MIVPGIIHVFKMALGRAINHAHIVPHTSIKNHFRNHFFCFCSFIFVREVVIYASKSFSFSTHTSDVNIVLFQNCISISHGNVLIIAIAFSKSCGSSGMSNQIMTLELGVSSVCLVGAIHDDSDGASGSSFSSYCSFKSDISVFCLA